jgi:hypothetical protein
MNRLASRGITRRLLAFLAGGHFLLALPLAGLLDDAACEHHLAGAVPGSSVVHPEASDHHTHDGHHETDHGDRDDGCSCPVLCEGMASPPALTVPVSDWVRAQPALETVRITPHRAVLPGPPAHLLPFSRPPPGAFLFA